jgi:predicted Zn-dependent protease
MVEKSAEIHDLLVRRGLVVAEGPAAEMVRRVGAAVAPQEPSDEYLQFRFFVLRNPVANAFALPDGSIYVHEGLLALLENEAQLASVLAHECMHSEGHHAIVHGRSTRKKVGGLLAFQIALSGVASDVGYLGTLLTDQLVSTFVVRSIIGYGRDLEEESDRRAVGRMLDAGYDPREMPRTFELLAEDPEGTRPRQRPKWSSHPLAVQRSAYLRTMLEAMSEDIAEREDRLSGLRVGLEDFEGVVTESARRSVREYLEADRPRMGLWLAKRNVARWPDRALFQSQLGDAWRSLDARSEELAPDALDPKAKKRAARERAESTRQERLETRLSDPDAAAMHAANLARAEAAYSAALALEPAHAPSLLGMGLLEESRGRDLAAGRWLVRYLQGSPDAPDRALVLGRIDDITRRLREEGEGS